MALTAVKFNSFVERLAEGGVDLSTGCRLLLSNVAPNAATNTVIGDITEIAAGTGYTAGGLLVSVNSSAQAGGVYSLVLNDQLPAWTATGTMGPFRYFILADTSGDLIQYWDNAAGITLNAGDVLNLDWAAFTVRIT